MISAKNITITKKMYISYILKIKFKKNSINQKDLSLKQKHNHPQATIVGSNAMEASLSHVSEPISEGPSPFARFLKYVVL